MLPENNTLTIITATLNASATIQHLISSLESQTNKYFKWLVVDGGSCDDTLSLIENSRGLEFSIDSQPDFGIYDALNRAIKNVDTEFYMVVGADDTLRPEAVANIIEACSDDALILSGSVVVGGKVISPRGSFSGLKGMTTFVSAHSVGTVLRTSLHDDHGFYSRKYPIAADQLFIGKLANAGIRVKVIDSVLGEFGTGGVSCHDYLGTATEFCRVQIELGYNVPNQIGLCMLRLLTYLFRKKKA
jgi:glycosyltransferase involved in cell wall biosynthesis